MYRGELLNSISHLVGAVLALVGFGVLLTLAVQSRDPLLIIGFTVFGVTLVLLYTMSTLYHSFHTPRLKRLFKILDHVSIYLLIAGTYTPFMLIVMPHRTGWTILAVVWLLALLGTLSEIYLRGRAVKITQVVIYLAMGWACAVDLGSLSAGLPAAGFWWVVGGGLAYTIGVVFYVLDKLGRLDHAHGIWHLFVLTGSIAHFVALVGFVR